MNKRVAAILALSAALLGTAMLFTVSKAPADITRLIDRCLTVTDPEKSIKCTNLVTDTAYNSSSVDELNAELLAGVARNSTTATRICHQIVEHLGALQARAEGVPALERLTYSCLGGVLHGVFYELGMTHDAAEMARMSVGICEKFAQGKPWVMGWDCRHGVGHAFGLDKKVPFPTLFDLCDQVYSSYEDRTDCGSGVMGSILESSQGRSSINGVALSEFTSWCSELHAPYDSVCLQRAGILLHLSDAPISKILSFCSGLPLDCQYGVGFAYGQAFDGLPASKRVVPCLAYESAGERVSAEACISGLIRAITPDYWLTASDPGVCQLAGSLSTICFSEQEKVRRRELTISQIRGRSATEYLERDPAAWSPDVVTAAPTGA